MNIPVLAVLNPLPLLGRRALVTFLTIQSLEATLFSLRACWCSRVVEVHSRPSR